MHRWLQLTALHIQAYKLEMCPMCANIFHNRKIMKYEERKKNWINEFHMRLTSMPQYRQDISNYRFMLESSWTSWKFQFRMTSCIKSMAKLVLFLILTFWFSNKQTTKSKSIGGIVVWNLMNLLNRKGLLTF